MTDLNRRALRSGVIGALVIAVLVFLPAWTLAYWQGWVFLAAFITASTAFAIDLAIRDPEAMKRRMRAGPQAETGTTQKIAALSAFAGAVALIVVSALDWRFGWSNVPPLVSLISDALVALSFLVFYFVMRENSYAAATIQVAMGQRVISTGPYAVVRHPMYAGALLLLVGTPLALGSLWGLAVTAAMIPGLIWRLTDEEKVLARDLPGYAAYMAKVSWRLIPWVY